MAELSIEQLFSLKRAGADKVVTTDEVSELKQQGITEEQIREYFAGEKDVKLPDNIAEAMGFVRSASSAPPTASSMAKAAKMSTTGTVINININITVNVVVEALANNDYSGLIDELINALTKEGGSFEAFLSALIQTLSTNQEVDLSSLETIINGLKTEIQNNTAKLEQQGIDISNLETKIDNLITKVDELDASVREALKFNYEFAADLGFKIGNLETLIKNADRRQMNMLSKIYRAVMTLSRNFNNFTKVEQEHYDNIMAKFGDINPSDPEAMKKLDTLYAMLLVMQKDTSATKANTEKILENQELIKEAIEGIDIDVEGYDDTEIKAMLLDLLSNQATQGAQINNIEAKVNNFKQMVDDLKQFIKDTVDAGKTEIINSMNAAADSIVNKHSEHISALSELLSLAIQSSKQEILDAIANAKPGEIDLTWIKERFDSLDGAVADNGKKLDESLKNQKLLITTLTDVQTRLIQLGGDVAALAEKVQEVIDIVSKLKNCDCEHLDVDDLLAKIEIIIKNVVVSNPNEGIINDQVNELVLLAKRARFDDEFTSVKEVAGEQQAPRKYNPEQPVYDLSGRPVPPSSMHKGQIYVQNGVKFVFDE